MGVKPSYIEVVNEFESRGLTLLSKEYIGANNLLEYICKCGSKRNIRLSKLKQGQTCKACSMYKSGKYKLTDVRAIFEVNGCFLLSTEYVDNNQLLEYICDCGEKSTTRLRSFMHGHRCLKCAPKKMGLGNIIHGQNSIHTNFELVNKQVVGYKSQSLDFICLCGNNETITCNNTSINQLHICRRCKLQKRLENKSRNSSSYQEWRLQVYEQDNYTCIKCSSRGGELAAHHIESWNDNKELRFELSNGITMCKTCHKDFHSLFGYNTTVEDLNKYL